MITSRCNFAACVLVVCASGATAQPPVSATPPQSLPSAASRDGPITRWDEGLPLGNGLFGVLVWGEKNVIRISLDRADLWDTRLPEVFGDPGWTYANMVALKEAKNHTEHQRLFDVPYDSIPYPTKLPAGRLEIVLPEGEAVTDFRLDLRDGTASIGIQHGPKAFGSAGVGIPSDGPTAVVFRVPKGCTIRLVPPTGVAALAYPAAETGSDANGAWFVQRSTGSLVYAAAASMVTSTPLYPGQPYITSVAVSVVSNVDAADPLAAARERAAAAADVYRVAASKQDEAARHRAAMQVSSVTIPDVRLQEHYDLCKHLFIAGSRPDAPPLALQGVWTADEGGLPPWKGDYHNDLNTQTTYLAYHAAGMNEQGLSWLNFNWRLLPQYQKFAATFYGLPDGAAVVPGVMTIDGQAMGGWGQHSLSPTHSAWVAQSFYLHWRYSHDREFLAARARPFCESVATSLLGLTKENEAGRLRLPLSTSPEIFDNAYKAWLPPNSNYDLSMLRFIFSACAEMAQAAGDTAAEARWRGALGKCEPFDVNPATGLTFARGFEYNESHRHFSHAMAIHPLGLMTVEGNDADREAIRVTLAQLEKMGTDWWTGYSFSWAACMFARAGEPEKALDYLTKYLAFTGPNGFHLNGDQTKAGLSKFTYRPFTLEGNFLAMQAVQEMLLQSWGEVGRDGSSVVRVFPAVSGRWADASFRDLRAEGGFRVSADRAGGKAIRVRVKADADGLLRLRDPFPGRDAVWSREVKRVGPNIEVTLARGEELVGDAK